MKFTESLEEFQKLEENKGKVILAKCGIFMVAIGKDAVLLHKILGLNVTCLKSGVCKVGIPLTHMVLYINDIERYYTLMVQIKDCQYGNYTSQCFANIYLNEMDQYAKHILKLKYWYRYMDDMIAIVKTKEEAIEKYNAKI